MRLPGRVLGWGRHHPPEIVTNHDLASRMDTSDEWIRQRTGISSRHVGGTTGHMASAAALDAVRRWGGDASELDLVVLATSTPDAVMPPTAAAVACSIGADCAVFDVNGACTGFVHALVTAYGMLAVGMTRALVVGADAMTTITDPADRGTAILFGDGAGAIIIEAGDADELGGLLAVDMGGDTSAQEILRCATHGFIEMQGAAVYKIAVRSVLASAEAALAKAGLTAAEVDLFVPHQANQRITDAVAARLGLADHTVVTTIADTGNTSAATIPAALAQAADDGRLTDGSIVLLSGFGAGMTWATAVLRWTTA